MTVKGRHDDGHSPVTAGQAPSETAEVFIRVFDSVGVDDADGPVDIGGPRQRRLLALLAMRAGSIVDVDWLAEYLWDDDDRPEATTPSLRTSVYRLRAALPEAAREWIETEPEGYRLAAPDDAVEHRRFAALRAEAMLARGRNDPASALELLDQALKLWRGEPFREIEDLEWAYAEIERLRMDRLEMLEERWEAALLLGRHTQIVGELAAFTMEHADRDRSVRQYALALHRGGRTAEALKVIASHKRVLVEDYGLDPSAAITELEKALLSNDPSLEVQAKERTLRGYRLLDEIGVGAFSVVWRASQPSVGREVAIKQIRSELANQPAFIRRFEAEAHLVARIEHPYIVPLIDFWRDPDSAYLVMRLLRGGTLEQRLEDGPMSLPATLLMARQVGAGLGAAHALGIIHRDVKPPNILFDEQGNAFLGDFGIALEASARSEVEVARTAGSPAYASPEQIRHEPLGPAADVFSLGTVLYECLRGSLPFSDRPSLDELVHAQLTTPYPPLSEVSADVPDSVSDAITRATAREAGDRYATIEAFVAALHASSDAVVGPLADDVPSVGATAGTIGNPYLGLRAFDDADAERFFGREQLVVELITHLAGDGPAGRCLVVAGPSGSGKSSVVRAGLIPALRGDAIPGSSDWFITTMVPGDDPYESLEAALLRVAVDPPPSLIETLRGDEQGILAGVRRCLGSEDDQLVLFIDQFEETFTGRSRDHADAFLEALSVVITEPSSPLRLVVTLRADYYDRPLEHPRFAPLLGPATINVTPLAGDELERAITEPARLAGVTFEPGLPARIAAESAGQPSPLPLLQYALSELFEHREGARLTAARFDEIGGLGGTIAARAEAIHGAATADERAAIRRVFGRLIDPAETTPDLRRRLAISDLDDDPSTEHVLERFGAARLLTFDRDVASREPTVEVAHEALLREWPRLAIWLDEDRELLRAADELADASRRWLQSDRSAEDLLRGERLDRAMEFVATRSLRVRPLDVEFVKASRVAARAAQAADKRRRRRQRILASGIGLALIVALAAGTFAMLQQSRADERALAATIAEDRAQLLTLTRRAAEDPDPKVGLLLALEAQRRAPGPETDAVLLAALGRVGSAETIDSLAPLATSRCAGVSPGWVSRDGTAQTASVDGIAVRRDLGTGEVVERGPMPSEGCSDWYGDDASGRRYAVSEDRSRLWLGPIAGPWDIDIKLDGNSWVSGPQGFAGSRMLLEGPGWVRLIDAHSGAPIGGPIIGLDAEPLVLLSPKGDIYAAASPAEEEGGRATIAVHDATDGRERFNTTVPAVATALYFDPITDELLVGTSGGRLVSIDLERGEVVADVGIAGEGVGEMAVRDDGKVIVLSAGLPRTVEVVDRQAGPLQAEPDGMDNVSGAVLRADGKLVTWNAESRVDVLDLQARPLVAHSIDLDTEGGPGPDSIEMHDGRALLVDASGVDDQVIDLATGERTPVDLRMPDGGRFPASSEPMLVDGGYTAISAELDVGLWEDGELVAERNVSPAQGDGLTAFTHTGSRVLVGSGPMSGNRTGQLLDVGAGDIRPMVTVSEDDVLFAAPTADDALLVVDSTGTLRTYAADGSVADEFATGVDLNDDLWQIATDGHGRTAFARPGALRGTTQVDIVDRREDVVRTARISGQVANVGFARAGGFLVVQTTDGAVRLHDVDAGVTSGVVWRGAGTTTHTPWYDEATDTVWVASKDQIVQLALDPEAWRARACQKVGRDLTQAEWDRLVPGGGTMVPACAASRPATPAG